MLSDRKFTAHIGYLPPDLVIIMGTNQTLWKLWVPPTCLMIIMGTTPIFYDYGFHLKIVIIISTTHRLGGNCRHHPQIW